MEIGGNEESESLGSCKAFPSFHVDIVLVFFSGTSINFRDGRTKAI